MKNVVSSLLLILAMGIMPGNAQNTQMPQQQKVEVNDAELAKFAEAFQKMRLANQEAQQKMMQIIQEKGMELQRFNEVHQAQQNPDSDVKMTADEKEKYKEIVAEFQALQPSFQKRMEDIISESGLTVDRYQELAMALRSDQELQQRLKDILQK
ncbi:hypothetical protein C7S20_11830 [Christiangramia fulva]|uniref:DUF4168 domain-containing protein n=1 Tax=Christiangramia fulva TaxID=2126553 RepID=A0A2R3ZAZ6_9FLAO|nr:hypothetical protein C7S20_11830 [Christiangramia fulva]